MAKMGRPKSDNAKKKSVNVRVEDALYERIRSYAAQHQMSMTEVVLLGLNMILSDPDYVSCPSSIEKEN